VALLSTVFEKHNTKASPAVTAPGRVSVRLVPEPEAVETPCTRRIEALGWAGAVTVSEVGLVTETPLADRVPNFTVSPLAKLDPVTVTVVPPALGPLVGLSPVTVGAGALV
jgi:hypothetical protein